MVVQTVINVVLLSVVYILMGIGFAFILNLLGIFNLAHGAIFMASSYGCYLLVVKVGLPGFVAFPLTVLAAASLAVWVYLLLGRGAFWRTRERPDGEPPARAAWPAVAAVVPARDEAGVIRESLSSLLTQDYPGPFAVVLVDDHSGDGTAAVARQAAHELGRADRLAVARARPLPEGWAGKVWALAEGVRVAEGLAPGPRYLWFTDADIAHDAANLRRLVAAAEGGDRDLVSLMVLLSCRGFWERLLIPPFVFFFQKLYPFAWVNDPGRRTAAAAGGCGLLRRDALARAGGLEPIQGENIDDSALPRRIKAEGRPGGGRIWLGLTRSARSVRPYAGLGEIWRMVARSAYTQLRHSPPLLAGTLAGMALTYLVPPLAALAYPLHGNAAAAALGLGAWALMALAFAPTARFYGLSAVFALSLPVAAMLYSVMTFDSARRHAQGRGATWKGRVRARAVP